MNLLLMYESEILIIVCLLLCVVVGGVFVVV